MRNLKTSICVFCGSSAGKNLRYSEQAKEFGKLLAQNNIRLIYGSGSPGIMGSIADAVLENGGEVIGIIPRFFDYDIVGHKKITEIIYVDTMAERKTKMFEMADAFITLPGGYGTLDELFEMLVLCQLQNIKKKNIIVNIMGFYDLLLNQLDCMVKEGFLFPEHRSLLIEEKDIHKVLAYLKSDWI